MYMEVEAVGLKKSDGYLEVDFENTDD